MTLLIKNSFMGIQNHHPGLKELLSYFLTFLRPGWWFVDNTGISVWEQGEVYE